MESDKIKELYKKTPLKKRPIQPSSLSPDEKNIAPKPRASTVPEGRLSKRKMLKPTKKLIDSYAESTAVIEPAPEAVHVPQTRASTRSKAAAAAAAKRTKKSTKVDMPMPASARKKKHEETKVPASTFSKSCSRITLTEEEFQDFNLAIELQKEEFNLRKRQPKIIAPDSGIKREQSSLPAKTKDTHESMDSNYNSSSEMPKEVGEKQGKRERTKIPKQTSVTGGKDKKDPFTGSQSQNYILSPELADIVGHQEISAGAIMDAMHYVFLERNLFEKDRKYVVCDDELSEKLFSGKRRMRFDDVKKYLRKHLTLSD